MSKFVRSVALSGDSTHAEAINEYFRKQFRKISTEDALNCLNDLGARTADGQCVNALALHDQFWIWETLEEAIIAKDFDIHQDENVLNAFMANCKGTPYLMDKLEMALYNGCATNPFQKPVTEQEFVDQNSK